MQIGGHIPENGVRGLLNELLLGGRDACDLSHLHLDVLDGVATGDGKRERGSISFDEELHTCVVAKPSVPAVYVGAIDFKRLHILHPFAVGGVPRASGYTKATATADARSHCDDCAGAVRQIDWWRWLQRGMSSARKAAAGVGERCGGGTRGATAPHS
jgi:hypothetical protein